MHWSSLTLPINLLLKLAKQINENLRQWYRWMILNWAWDETTKLGQYRRYKSWESLDEYRLRWKKLQQFNIVKFSVKRLRKHLFTITDHIQSCQRVKFMLHDPTRTWSNRTQLLLALMSNMRTFIHPAISPSSRITSDFGYTTFWLCNSKTFIGISYLKRHRNYSRLC